MNKENSILQGIGTSEYKCNIEILEQIKETTLQKVEVIRNIIDKIIEPMEKAKKELMIRKVFQDGMEKIENEQKSTTQYNKELNDQRFNIETDEFNNKFAIINQAVKDCMKYYSELLTNFNKNFNKRDYFEELIKSSNNNSEEIKRNLNKTGNILKCLDKFIKEIRNRTQKTNDKTISLKSIKKIEDLDNFQIPTIDDIEESFNINISELQKTDNNSIENKKEIEQNAINAQTVKEDKDISERDLSKGRYSIDNSLNVATGNLENLENLILEYKNNQEFKKAKQEFKEAKEKLEKTKTKKEIELTMGDILNDEEQETIIAFSKKEKEVKNNQNICNEAEKRLNENIKELTNKTDLIKKLTDKIKDKEIKDKEGYKIIKTTLDNFLINITIPILMKKELNKEIETIRSLTKKIDSKQLDDIIAKLEKQSISEKDKNTKITNILDKITTLRDSFDINKLPKLKDYEYYENIIKNHKDSIESFKKVAGKYIEGQENISQKLEDLNQLDKNTKKNIFTGKENMNKKNRERKEIISNPIKIYIEKIKEDIPKLTPDNISIIWGEIMDHKDDYNLKTDSIEQKINILKMLLVDYTNNIKGFDKIIKILINNRVPNKYTQQVKDLENKGFDPDICEHIIEIAKEILSKN